MTTSVCTLFEKDYHHGVAALVNSLLRAGFRGRVYAGYRGSLPHWAEKATPSPIGPWHDAALLPVLGECEIAFLPMRTSAHFTNIKPDFMLQIFAEPSLRVDKLFYLDPDICVVERWQFLADWISCGVALCEDVNSPVEQHHPRREGWRRHFGAHGISFEFPTAAYVNGGCVGISRAELAFLENWQRLSRYMADIIGGLGASLLEGGDRVEHLGFAECFDRSDQDVLNAAMGMTGGIKYSILPQAAMAFVPGQAVLPHAVGSAKPWRRRYLREALVGRPPGPPDKAFWDSVGGPLFSVSTARIRRQRASLRLASGIGRWYQRR
jgi:hypothetical protein